MARGMNKLTCPKMTEWKSFRQLVLDASYDVLVFKHIIKRLMDAVEDKAVVSGYLTAALDELEEAMLQADADTQQAVAERIRLVRESYGFDRQPPAQTKKRSHLRLVVSREDDPQQT